MMSMYSDRYRTKGFTTKSFLNAIFPDHNKGKDVYYQG